MDLGPAGIESCFKASPLDPETFCAMIAVLVEGVKLLAHNPAEGDVCTAVNVLQALSRSAGFTLVCRLLSSEEKRRVVGMNTAIRASTPPPGGELLSAMDEVDRIYS